VSRPADFVQATEFEYRHQTLLHQLIIAAAFCTYFLDRDDIVWRFVKENAGRRGQERALFLLATLLMGFSAAICTWARACSRSGARVGARAYFRYPQYIGDLVYAIALGSWAPLWGFILLVTGEAVRLFRLIQREENGAGQTLSIVPLKSAQWSRAFRREAAKWGLFATLVVFTITLKDRLAEILAVLSLLLWILLNLPLLIAWRKQSDL
jgi:hypothetical protein